MNTSQPTDTDQGQPAGLNGSVPDRLIQLLVQLQRNRKYGGFGAPSNPTGDKA